MAKKSHPNKPPWVLSRRMQLVVLPLFACIAAGVVVLTVLAIILMPQVNNNAKNGVGANGFRAFEEQNTSLGVDRTVTKEEVADALGGKSKTVDKSSTTNVFNLNGNRGQTTTFPFTRADGNKASVYVDVMLFKNTAAFDEAHVTQGTTRAGSINGKPAYYMHAQTLGSDREYRLLVVSGLKVYKFVVVQPYRNITITEVSALAAMRKLASKADL